jgi:hypothetical protein
MRNVLVVVALLFMASSASAASCDPPPGLDAALRGKRILMFGDFHGTNEIPDFVGRVACALEAEGRSVLVGLEFPRSEQAKIDSFLMSAGTADDKSILTAGPFWNSKAQDGRRGTAMVRLFDTLRAVKQGHPTLSVIAFDTSATPNEDSGKPRDIAMADDFRRAFDAAPAGTIGVVFVGSLHDTRTEAPNGVKPMVEQLERNGDTLALTEGDAGGTAYNMQSDGAGLHAKNPTACGGGNPEVPSIVLNETRLRNFRWDGCFFVGPVTASLPISASAGQ